MRRLVVDTDVVSYIFNWHPSAPRYVELLESNEVVLPFITPAELVAQSLCISDSAVLYLINIQLLLMPDWWA